jgi:hypothetical protein
MQAKQDHHILDAYKLDAPPNELLESVAIARFSKIKIRTQAITRE